ncbi:MAG: hypothetical protein ACFE8U_05885 [Candidatus Hermodarchaeota archaeon]
MVNFCSKCGAKVFEDSTFCEYCGNRLKAPKLTPRFVQSPTVESTKKSVYRSPTNGPPKSGISQYSNTYYKPTSSGINWSAIIAIFFIVILGFIAVAVLASLIFIPFSFNQVISEYNYIGDKTFSIDELGNTTKLELEIYNSVGSVSINLANMSQLYEARISVYAREGYSLRDANTFQEDYYNDTQYISFYSGSGGSWDDPYNYELDITVSTLVAITLDVEISTGSIDILAQEAIISNIALQTSTGSITTEFHDVFFNTSDPLSIGTSTGSISAIFYNSNYSSNIVNWDIDTSTGSIELDINQDEVINNTRIDYDVSVSTGSIDCYYSLNPEMGLSLYAGTSLGSIFIDGYSTDESYIYTSENINTALMIFDLELSSSTGSITIISDS